MTHFRFKTLQLRFENLQKFGLTSLLLMLTLSLTSCLDPYLYDPPPANYIYNYAGKWEGVLTEQATNPRSANVTVTILPHNYSQDSSSNYYTNEHYYDLKGTWSAAFSPSLNATGIFSGSADGYSTNFWSRLTFGDDTNCSISVNATRIGDSIVGVYEPDNYSNENCSFSNLKVGSFTLNKQ